MKTIVEYLVNNHIRKETNLANILYQIFHRSFFPKIKRLSNNASVGTIRLNEKLKSEKEKQIEHIRELDRMLKGTDYVYSQELSFVETSDIKNLFCVDVKVLYENKNTNSNVSYTLTIYNIPSSNNPVFTGTLNQQTKDAKDIDNYVKLVTTGDDEYWKKHTGHILWITVDGPTYNEICELHINK